ncbi:MAG TPA: methylated-DNA--[protein]-cysteine S-methyltransferase [Geminicoccaceae bacterium]|nr:methylated-DNA--[protein]-cysteine S-methyltransferase [Geminicoccus sp.]HMU53092.1 methylated-DNA--[protein]-cysteine S-methyltransferase [Geminicoccaceae bacterium]
MASADHTTFDTVIGRCGIGWNERGLVSVRLPGRWSLGGTGHRAAGIPSAACEAMRLIAASLRGEPVDLGAIALDMRGLTEFARSVYGIARTVPAGSTTTYGEIATRLGDRALAREVGQALGRNPFPIVVPCHRVLAAGGAPGGFSAPGGVATKLRLLAIEGVRLASQPSLFDDPTGAA